MQSFVRPRRTIPEERTYSRLFDDAAKLKENKDQARKDALRKARQETTRSKSTTCYELANSTFSRGGRVRGAPAQRRSVSAQSPPRAASQETYSRLYTAQTGNTRANVIEQAELHARPKVRPLSDFHTSPAAPGQQRRGSSVESRRSLYEFEDRRPPRPWQTSSRRAHSQDAPSSISTFADPPSYEEVPPPAAAATRQRPAQRGAKAAAAAAAAPRRRAAPPPRVFGSVVEEEIRVPEKQQQPARRGGAGAKKSAAAAAKRRRGVPTLALSRSASEASSGVAAASSDAAAPPPYAEEEDVVLLHEDHVQPPRGHHGHGAEAALLDTTGITESARHQFGATTTMSLSSADGESSTADEQQASTDDLAFGGQRRHSFDDLRRRQSEKSDRMREDQEQLDRLREQRDKEAVRVQLLVREIQRPRSDDSSDPGALADAVARRRASAGSAGSGGGVPASPLSATAVPYVQSVTVPAGSRQRRVAAAAAKEGPNVSGVFSDSMVAVPGVGAARAPPRDSQGKQPVHAAGGGWDDSDSEEDLAC